MLFHYHLKKVLQNFCIPLSFVTFLISVWYFIDIFHVETCFKVLKNHSFEFTFLLFTIVDFKDLEFFCFLLTVLFINDLFYFHSSLKFEVILNVVHKILKNFSISFKLTFYYFFIGFFNY